jgi:hypothetical protein
MLFVVAALLAMISQASATSDLRPVPLVTPSGLQAVPLVQMVFFNPIPHMSLPGGIPMVQDVVVDAYVHYRRTQTFSQAPGVAGNEDQCTHGGDQTLVYWTRFKGGYGQMWLGSKLMGFEAMPGSVSRVFGHRTGQLTTNACDPNGPIKPSTVNCTANDPAPLKVELAIDGMPLRSVQMGTTAGQQTFPIGLSMAAASTLPDGPCISMNSTFTFIPIALARPPNLPSGHFPKPGTSVHYVVPNTQIYAVGVEVGTDATFMQADITLHFGKVHRFRISRQYFGYPQQQ